LIFVVVVVIVVDLCWKTFFVKSRQYTNT